MYNIGKDKATYVAADSTQQKEVTNASGATVYYKAEADVDSGDTALVVGASVQIVAGTYFVSAGQSRVQVRDLIDSTAEDVTATDDLAVGGDAAVTGATTLTGKVHAVGEVEIDGDLNHDGTKIGFFGTAPVVKKNVKPAAEVNAKELCEALEAYGLIE